MTTSAKHARRTLIPVDGGYYQSREGKIYGPLMPTRGLQNSYGYKWTDGSAMSWTARGRYFMGLMLDPHDLVERI